MIIGVAYYPEQWPQDRWAEDARLIKAAGIDAVRLAEFAWSRLEPRRAHYDMGWLADAVEILAAEGLHVLLCTPTATPPMWLFNRHPHMAPQSADGAKWYPGSRRQACLNNPAYRRYVRRIVREMARTFGANKTVIGWQIDNEIGCHASGRCYCDDCEQAFREWLKKRYGTIGRLNSLWGTSFWSQETPDWQFVPSPRRTPAGVHPSLALDYERFITATAREFIQEQKEIIEEYSSAQKPITTNAMGTTTDQFDQFSLAGVQDVASYDNYPGAGGNLDGVALQLDLTRSVKRKPFWVLEQQAGPTMIRSRHSRPRPGQLRLWSYQAAARGAETISYFRWRTCRAGQEMHWYGMLDPNGAQTARFEEIKDTIGQLKEKGSLWKGRLPRAEVAISLSYESHWALRADSMTADVDYLGQLKELYGHLRRRGVQVDILPPEADPKGYRALVVPMPMIVRRESAKLWERFAEDGGWVLATAPAGYRTEQNTWVMDQPPGVLAALLGVHVPEHDVLGFGESVNVTMGDTQFTGGSLLSLVELKGAEAIATCSDGYYRDMPVITRNVVGQGGALFLGCVPDDGLMACAVERFLDDAGLTPHPWSSETVEVVRLEPTEEGDERTFVLNHSAEPVSLPVEGAEPCRDLLTGRGFAGELPLEGYEVVLVDR